MGQASLLRRGYSQAERTRSRPAVLAPFSGFWYSRARVDP
jgi:hypothetical protein